MEAQRPSRVWDRQPCRCVSLGGRRSNIRTLRWCTPDLPPVISERRRSMALSERLPPSRQHGPIHDLKVYLAYVPLLWPPPWRVCDPCSTAARRSSAPGESERRG